MNEHNVIFEELNYDDPKEIFLAAKIHESSPLNWDPTWKVTDQGIQQWVNRINEFKNTHKMFLLFAKLATNEIIGFHWLRIYEKNGEILAHIDSLWVDEIYRKQGIGSELKKLGETWAKNQSAKAITTNVFYENNRMLAFNLKLGFKPEALKMTKRL